MTFLGRSALVGREAGAAYVARRAGAWPAHWRVLTGKNATEALAILREPGALGAQPCLPAPAPASAPAPTFSCPTLFPA